MSLKIKLCGFKHKQDIDFASKFNISFMGFVFYKNSPRNVELEQISKIIKDIPTHIKKVAVTVDASNEELGKIIKVLKPDFLQLHGSESEKRTREIKDYFQIPIIKAFKISNKDDLDQIKFFEDVADYFLFDANAGDLKGGGGKSFDWNILKDLKTKKEWFLSGGINADNLSYAINTTNAKMVDLSSSIEEVKGIKSKSLIEKFMKIATEVMLNPISSS